MTHFVTRAVPIHDIDCKSPKTELKSSRNYSTNHIKSNPATSHLWPRGTYAHTYRKRGKFHWAKLLWYPQYTAIHGNTFAVQSQGAHILLYLEQKIHRKNFHTSLKKPRKCESLAQWNPFYGTFVISRNQAAGQCTPGLKITSVCWLGLKPTLWMLKF